MISFKHNIVKIKSILKLKSKQKKIMKIVAKNPLCAKLFTHSVKCVLQVLL